MLSVAAGTASISGIMWEDRNANGIWETSDGRLANFTVYLDLNHDAQLDAGDPTALTDGNGDFQFTGLAAGAYTVRYVNQPLYHPSGTGTNQTVVLADGQSVSNVYFGATLANGQIAGTVLDADGATPVPVAQGWGAYLDTNNNGRVDPGEPWTAIDAQGHFSFSSLLAGTYSVRIDPPHRTWSPAAGSSASATVVSDGRAPSAPLSFSFVANAPPVSYNINQLVDYQLVGGSSNDPATRMVFANMQNLGWTGYVAMLQPDIAGGARRIEMHNPFGTLPTDTVFPFDQYTQAQAAGLTWLTNNFVSAWRPVTASGVEVISYIGSPEQEASFQALAALGDSVDWNARFNAAVAPFVQAGMSIAFDLGQRQLPGDFFYQAIQGLQAQGVKVYLENRPNESTPNMWNFPIVATEPGWDGSSPYYDPTDFYWGAKNSELPAGNVLRLMQQPPSTPQAVLATMQNVMYTGDSVGISFSLLRQMGITVQQALTPGNNPLLGDVNGDGTVNVADLLIVARNYGHAGTFAQGDLNGDGTVNFADLLIVSHNFGRTRGVTSTASSSTALAAVAPATAVSSHLIPIARSMPAARSHESRLGRPHQHRHAHRLDRVLA